MAYGSFNKYMRAAAEIGRNPASKHQIQPASMEMSRLTRDGTTAEPVSRDQTLRRERGHGREISIFSVQLTTNRIVATIPGCSLLLFVLLQYMIYIDIYVCVCVMAIFHTHSIGIPEKIKSKTK